MSSGIKESRVAPGAVAQIKHFHLQHDSPDNDEDADDVENTA